MKLLFFSSLIRFKMTYIFSVRNTFVAGSWYHFNDSCVSLVSEEAVARCKAYILFYTRRHPETAIVEKIKGKLIS